MANSYNAVTVTTSPTLILALKNHREGCLIVNNSAQTVYLGMDANVTTATGLPIVSGAVLNNAGYTHAWRGAIYGIVAATTAVVNYWDWENI